MVAAMGILLLLIGYGLGYIFGGSTTSGIAGLVIALVIWAIMNLVAYFQGDSLLLSMSKAIKISPDDHPRLYNVVEEMKIASGLEKIPDVYIIDDPALNALLPAATPAKPPSPLPPDCWRNSTAMNLKALSATKCLTSKTAMCY